MHVALDITQLPSSIVKALGVWLLTATTPSLSMLSDVNVYFYDDYIQVQTVHGH